MGYFLSMATAEVISMVEYVAIQSRKQEEDMQAARRASGDGGNGMEARMVRLETLAEVTERRLTAIESDTKEIRKEIASAKIWALLLFGAGWVSLVGVMAKGFGWLK